MSNEDAHYPTIMQLKTIEFEMNLLLNAYDVIHKTYLQNIIDKDYSTAAKNLVELQQINTALQTGSSEGIALLDKAINEGNINQEIVIIQKQRLDQIIRQAESQKAITKRLQKELLNAEGELEATTLLQESNSLQYTIMIIVGLIVAGLTVKTITSNDVSMLDNAILAIVVGLIVYFLIKKLM
ncbi:MAG: hypothetical protein CMB96_05210 [Flavobacteriaceae bacterium]|nr:hypothetical protein [Flavobacteriaceae bacterium]|tara:strand:+ start:245 stop:793 length:549 start_codon:yes stop_codon:yes gene_type:complete